MTPLVRRVLARAQAKMAAPRPMKPEKLQALMLKLRKGSGFGAKMKDLKPVFLHLGWKFEQSMALYDKGGGLDWGKPMWHHCYSEEEAKQKREEAKKKEVSTLPDPDSLSKGEVVYQDIGDIKPGSAPGTAGFYAKTWVAVPTIRVVSPKGASFLAFPLSRSAIDDTGSASFDNEYASLLTDRSRNPPVNFEKWLKGEGGFVDQINEALGTPSLQLEKEQKERERREKALTEENAGTCGACFGIYKLAPKTREGKDKSMPGMVLHGYERPGIGYIDGNCLGVGYPPYELSTEATVMMRSRVKGALEQKQDELARWKDRIKDGPQTIDELHDSSSIDFVNRKIVDKKLYRKDFTERDWARKIESRTDDIVRVIDRMDTDLKMLDRKIREWKQAPLRSKA